MKLSYFFKRFALVVSHMMTLSLPLSMQASTEGTHYKIAEPQDINGGRFMNGMHYVVQQANNLHNACFLTIKTSVPYTNDNKFLFYVLQHALFNGTSTVNRLTTETILTELGLDVNIDNYIIYNQYEQSLRFSLCDQSGKNTLKFLKLLEQLLSSPELTNEGIELAKHHLFDTLPLTYDEQLALQSVTAMQVQDAYKEWLAPNRLILIALVSQNTNDFINSLTQAFGSIESKGLASDIQINHDIEDSLEAGYKLPWSIDPSRIQKFDDGTCLIDGKIKMKEPKGLQKKSNGYALGALMIVVGLGSAAAAALVTGGSMIPVFCGLLAAASFGSSIYLSCTNYLNDPNYIAKLRTEDLRNGSASAYKRGCIKYTLTPYERRVLFIQELLNTDAAIPLASLPINLLSKVYQLGDPVIYELFTLDECNALKQIKNELINHSNVYSQLLKNLESELVNLTDSYARDRDFHIKSAKTGYENSYPFVQNRILNEELKKHEEALKKIQNGVAVAAREVAPPSYNESANDNDQERYPNTPPPSYYQAPDLPPSYEAATSLSEDFIKQQINHCKQLIQANSVALELVKTTYDLELMKAQQYYKQAIEDWKLQIDYHNKKAELSFLAKDVHHYYNKKLQAMLTQFPVNPLALPDYIDRTP